MTQTGEAESRPTFRTLLLTSVLEPMVAGIVGDHGPIRDLRAEVCVGPPDRVFARATGPSTGIQQGYGLAENEDELVWAVISTPNETLAYAMGTKEIDVEGLNYQIDDLAGLHHFAGERAAPGIPRSGCRSRTSRGVSLRGTASGACVFDDVGLANSVVARVVRIYRDSLGRRYVIPRPDA